ncbi:MAG: hypothetical protein HY000_39385 [Planctomycetes bacterium]|nr:hypothetical protein [Planctomycetota bacterium]
MPDTRYPLSRLPLLALLAACAAGCAMTPPPAPVALGNPALIPILDRELVWNTTVDVVDDYFQIEREDRVRLVGDVLIEGRIDTYPLVGSTLFEPWRHDSSDAYEKLESTLQSMRRRAVVRVIPDQPGFLVDVAVFKELEDVRRPERATAGAATFRNDSSLERFTEPVGGQAPTYGWIPRGRDVVLEQEIIAKLQTRFGQTCGPRLPIPGWK